MEVFDGLRLGAMASALGLGLRHGFDWDHVAAITDITGSQSDSRRSFGLSTLYIVGHAVVVTALGVLAIAAGSTVPAWLDGLMGRIVGATLVGLGVYVLVSLARHGRRARLRSRWMLAIAAARRVMRRFRSDAVGEPVVIDHDHEHPLESHHGDSAIPTASAGPATAGVETRLTHRHRHHHLGSLPDDPFVEYTRGSAVLVGMLHGVGAETPTQMVIFATAAGATSAWIGVGFLLAFVVGLMVSNTAIALASRAGVLSASKNFAVYATVSVAVALLSLYLGVVYLFALGDGLPGLLT